MSASLLIQYLAFACGVSCLYLAVVLLTLVRSEARPRILLPVGVFAAGAAVGPMLYVAGELVDGTAWVAEVLPRLIIALSILLSWTPRKLLLPALRPWAYVPLFLVAASTAALPRPVVSVAALALFVLSAGAAGWALLRQPGDELAGATKAAPVVGAALFGAAVIALMRGALELSSEEVSWSALRLATATIVAFSCSTVIVAEPPGYLSPEIRVLVRLRSAFVVLFAFVLVAGLPVYWLRAESARKDLEVEEQQTLAAASDTVLANIARADILARLLSTNGAIAPLFGKPGPAARAVAEEAIDRNASVQPSAVGLLLDADGVVVAASNRALPESMVGRSLADQLLFTDAALGYQGRQFAATAAPRKRSYQSSAPVRSADGRVVGVAVIEADLERWNLMREGPTIVLLVDAVGTVFLSSRTQWEQLSLWPPAQAAAFPTGFSPLLALEPHNGELVTLNDRGYLVSRGPTPLPGWSLMVFSLAQEMNTGLLLSLAGVFALSIVMVALVALQNVWVVSNSRLALAESRYRALVEGAPLWISLLDHERRVTMTNPAGNAAWRGPADLIGTPFASLWPQEVRAGVEEALSRADRGETTTLELPAPGPDGDPRVWSVSLRPLGLGATRRRQILVVGEDVTSRRLAERTAFVTERLAAIGALAAGVAHRFNNINMGLLATLEALERVPTDATRKASLFEGAKRLVRLAGEVSGRLLDFARPSGGARTLTLLGTVVSEVANLYEEAMRGEGIDFRLTLADDVRVSVDLDRIKYVIVSLVTNARQALVDRDVRRIEISTGSSSDGVTLRVADSGAGLARDAQHLFNPFYTTKGEWAQPGSSEARTSGLGLSLSVCQAIVHAHGGRIEAGGGPDGGAVFVVSLPAADPDSPALEG